MSTHSNSGTRKKKNSGRTETAKHRIRSFLYRKTNEMYEQNQSLISYVTQQEYGKNKKMIETFCKKQPPQTLTLYRGHMNSTEIRKNLWFSASKSKKVAKEEFAGKNCCVFTIHAVNVPILDVNKFVKGKIGKYAEEQEFIVLGGGTFYKDKLMTEPGFSDRGDGEYVCWYTLNNQKTMKKSRSKTKTPPSSRIKDEQALIQSFVDQIPEEEYDLIGSPGDIFFAGITDAQRRKVFDIIIKKRNAQ